MGLRERIEARREGREPRIEREAVQPVITEAPRRTPEWLRRQQERFEVRGLVAERDETGVY